MTGHPDDDANILAAAYTTIGSDEHITAAVPNLIRRARTADAWFDEECREAKRLKRARTVQPR